MALRALAVVCVTVGAVVSAGCGATSSPAKALATAVTPATACYVGIFFVRSETRAERTAVAATLRTDPLIASYRYRSRAQALAAEAKKYPELVKSLTSNPLSDSFRAVPKPHVSAYKVIAELKARKFRGVANINGNTVGGIPCGYLP